MALRERFLSEKTELLASKMHTSEEKALCAILCAESSQRLFRNLHETSGKQQTLLTQIDILSQRDNPSSPDISVTTKEDLECKILVCNQSHSKQSLKTPFMNIPFLCKSINPHDLENLLDHISNGVFVDLLPQEINLSAAQIEKISSLTRCLHEDIPLTYP